MAAVKHRRNKKNQGLVTKVIVYQDSACPQRPAREITVDVRRDEIVDTGYAAAMVALRTGTALDTLRIIDIRNT